MHMRILCSMILITGVACLTGCHPDVSSDYQVVNEALAPEMVEMTEEVVTTPAEDVTASEGAIPLDAPSRNREELSVDTSRPFAVPMPEVMAGPPLGAEMQVATASPDIVNRIQLLIPDRQFATESDGSVRVTYDDLDLLKVLNMEPVPLDAVDHFPVWLSQLNGRQVRIRGWMFPPFRTEGISKFMMMRDSGLCCFGPTPKIYDKIAVYLRDGVTTNHIQGRPFDVTGRLVIEPDIEDEEWMLLYHIEDATISE